MFKERIEQTDMDLRNQLEQTKTETLVFFELEEEDLDKSYAKGKWTIRYILHHLADTETVLFDRIRRIISEPRQVLWDFDQDAWVKNLDYDQRPLKLSKKIYSAVRDGLIYYIDPHYVKQGDLEYVHSVAGIRTLKGEFEKVASHNQHHLDQIREALG